MSVESSGPSGPVENSPPTRGWAAIRDNEDWLAVILGAVILLIAFGTVFLSATSTTKGYVAGESLAISSAKPDKWTDLPTEAFTKKGRSLVAPIATTFAILLGLFTVATWVAGRDPLRFAIAFCGLFALAMFSYLLAGQAVIKSNNLEYALWALFVGVLISNTVGVPDLLRPGLRTEFYMKTGLVVLGAENLLPKLLTLGLPGIGVAWVVTPVVLVSTYLFGQKVLKLSSRSLNMTISADMSVCGVSAAIATAAACRAKKEELSLAIGLSLTFTAVMMVVLPIVIRATGMDPILGGAWIGGTIDATGAVLIAGEALNSDDAAKVAMTIKIIQNVLIGVVAFFVAVYWASFVDRESGRSVGAEEIWRRFPKFVIGFMLASILFSILSSTLPGGPGLLKQMLEQITKGLRGWLFCIAFVCIGLELNFKELRQHFHGGKPLVLYACGQSLNLLLTLGMSYLMFEVMFKESVTKILNP